MILYLTNSRKETDEQSNKSAISGEKFSKMTQKFRNVPVVISATSSSSDSGQSCYCPNRT